ncbi:MAG: flagella basal body P-ring formation protein FlgA [Candidatus Acidiferrales bacterium]
MLCGAAILAITLTLNASPTESAAKKAPGAAKEAPRAAHLLTRAEILSAIAHALEANRIQTVRPLTVNDLSPFADVTVASSTPELRVTQIEADSAGRAFRALIWTVDEPKTPPFWVTVNAQFVPSGPRIAEASDPEIARASSPEKILVSAGERSTIVVEGNGFRIQATGIALDRGTLGQTVRVRTLATGQIIKARVTGEHLLSAIVAEASQ